MIGQAYITVTKTRAIRAAQRHYSVLNDMPNPNTLLVNMAKSMLDSIINSDGQTVMIAADSELAGYIDNVDERNSSGKPNAPSSLGLS